MPNLISKFFNASQTRWWSGKCNWCRNHLYVIKNKFKNSPAVCFPSNVKLTNSRISITSHLTEWMPHELFHNRFCYINKITFKNLYNNIDFQKPPKNIVMYSSGISFAALWSIWDLSRYYTGQGRSYRCNAINYNVYGYMCSLLPWRGQLQSTDGGLSNV